MIIHHCCEVAANDLRVEPFAVRTRRARFHLALVVRCCLDLAGWVVPSALLVFMPKCPACFAAYIAMATGLGLSITAVAHLRMLLIILSGGFLLFLAAGRIRPMSLIRKEKTL